MLGMGFGEMFAPGRVCHVEEVESMGEWESGSARRVSYDQMIDDLSVFDKISMLSLIICSPHGYALGYGKAQMLATPCSASQAYQVQCWSLIALLH